MPETSIYKNKLIPGCFFTLALMGCDQAAQWADTPQADIAPQELERFIKSVLNNLIFVEGGEFLMGDYGSQLDETQLPYDANKDSKPLHSVELSGFSIGKFKVTNQEFMRYLEHNNLKLRRLDEGNQKDWEDIRSTPNTPAHMDWFEAEKYCNWLASITQLPFALPTEAQWEYAARSRGQFLMVATDDGTYKATRVPATERDGPRGINISTSWDREAFAKQMGWQTQDLSPLPVDQFPPNPLGLYAMSDNGFEWVNDWYDPDYYQYSPVKDPQGPEKPVFKGPASNNQYAKVLRGVDYANPTWGGGVNVQRRYKNPDAYVKNFVLEEDILIIGDKTARCVVNSPLPVKSSS